MENPNPEKQQHFLKNEEILKKEIKLAKLKKTDYVIEIGSGDGRLSKLISEKVKKLISYETDTNFKKTLENLKLKNTKFIFENALKHSWEGYNKIVSNIPYSLSEPVLMKAVKDGIKELTLIVGENFSNLLKNNETKVGVIGNLYFEINFIEKINKKEFEPSPRVDSYLVHMTRKKPSEAELILQSILEKDGKTKNAIIKVLQNYGKTKNEGRKIIDEMNLNMDTLNKSTKNMSGKFMKILNEKLKKYS